MQFIDQKQKAALPLEISSLDIEKANIASSTSVAKLSNLQQAITIIYNPIYAQKPLN